MATKQNNYPRHDLTDHQLFRLALYFIYVSPKVAEVTSFFNQIQQPCPKISITQVKSTYRWLHDQEHPMWKRARDMNRNEAAHLKVILTCEVGLESEKSDTKFRRPAMPMAHLRPGGSK